MSHKGKRKSLLIFMLGSGNGSIISPLVSALKASEPSLRVTASGLIDMHSREILISKTGFEDIDHCVEGFSTKLPGKEILVGKAGMKPKPQLGWKEIYKTEIRFLLMRLWGARHLTKRFRYVEDNSDIIHLHSLAFTQAHFFLMKREKRPLVISCWGSDVFRNANIGIISAQQALLRRADAITVSGPEFKEVVLSKYGRDLEPKIHFAFFDPDVVGLSTLVSPDRVLDFRQRFEVPEDSRVICLGHNGFRENQHLSMIASLALLSETERRTLKVLVPMTYGGDSSYQDEVEDALLEARLDGTVLRDYLSNQDNETLRIATDVLLYAPVSDAFSATVSQALAAGSWVILGSWLPYKARRMAGMDYTEVDSPADVGPALQKVLATWDSLSSQRQTNRLRSAEFFSRESLGAGWMKAYHAALDHFSQ